MTGASSPNSHTITIDGNKDFLSGYEQFPTTSASYYGYVTWDSTYLYLGMEGADIDSNDAAKWILIYLDGIATNTSTTGRTYNTQAPTLPFSAGYHIAWSTDNGSTTAMTYDGASWSDASWDFTGDVSQSGTFMEMRIPLADIGVTPPATVNLHMSMINEAGGGGMDICRRAVHIVH